MPKMQELKRADAKARIKDPNDGKHKRGKDGREVSDDEVDTALAAVDQQGIIDAAHSDTETVIWDRTSPINGVEASKVFAGRNDIGAGEVYLVMRKSDGRVIQFQPFKPRVGARQQMTKAEAETIGEGAREDVANGRAVREITIALGAELDKL